VEFLQAVPGAVLRKKGIEKARAYCGGNVKLVRCGESRFRQRPMWAVVMLWGGTCITWQILSRHGGQALCPG